MLNASLVSSDPLAAGILQAAGRSAERKVAAKLNMESHQVAFIAHSLWGCGLTEERDRRLKETVSSSARSAQAQRGHITRALVAELATAKEQHCS